jgi:hypothetical protein
MTDVSCWSPFLASDFNQKNVHPALTKQSRITQVSIGYLTNQAKNKTTSVVLSFLAEHEKNTSHHIDWQNTRVLWRDNNPYRLLIKESLVIRAHEPQLNRTAHSVPLLVFHEGLERSLIPDPNG